MWQLEQSGGQNQTGSQNQTDSENQTGAQNQTDAQNQTSDSNQSGGEVSELSQWLEVCTCTNRRFGHVTKPVPMIRLHKSHSFRSESATFFPTAQTCASSSLVQSNAETLSCASLH